MTNSFKENIYSDDYFIDRHFNDKKRLKQFTLDGNFLRNYKESGVICDVGCSTGEFLKSIAWNGDIYGMEINLNARKEAELNGIGFDKNIFTEKNFFDVVVFRGTIQHVEDPFRMIMAAYSSLKDGGIIAFIATPNTDSILYRLKLDLPFLDSSLNYYLPGVKNLSNILKNCGFQILAIEKPYWKTPYRKFYRDIFLFICNIFSAKFYKHPFWGSSISLVARK